MSTEMESGTAQRWFDTAQFINPALFTFGNVGRTLPDVRAPGTVNWDLSFIKYPKILETASLQFRAKAFNFQSHVNLGIPATRILAGL
jgi:hypothetical protein